MQQKKRLVIVGGGFAGLNMLSHIDRRKWDVVIIDANNYHSFPPLFYQVASSGLDPASICFPLRREVRRRKVRGASYRMGRVSAIDVERREVTTQYETIGYDALVVAAGTTNNYFGIAGLDKYVYTLKSTAEAMRCRNNILDRLERAAITPDPAERRRLLSFVVIGGGPTGVEIAGAMGEMKRYILSREYPSIDVDDVSITLIEGTDRLLGTMSARSSAEALKYLNDLMVNVELGKIMKRYDGTTVTFADGSAIDAETVIWTAGVTGNSFEWRGVELTPAPGNRLPVDEFNRVAGTTDVYAIGDIAYHSSERFPKGCPQLAQVAIQQARTLARNLNGGTFSRPFGYKDKGSMATVGRNRAVVDLGKVHFGGRFAWLTWMAVHLVTLLGMRNKVTVFINWIWGYFTYSSSLRLLFRAAVRPCPSKVGIDTDFRRMGMTKRKHDDCDDEQQEGQDKTAV